MREWESDSQENNAKGWKLLCSWKDGSSDWVDLKDLKDLNPIKVAEYAMANNKIQEEPAFKWWVSDVLRHRNRIINKVKSRYWKLTHKFGIKMLHSIGYQEVKCHMVFDVKMDLTRKARMVACGHTT
jgi:hypothetical protein